MTECNGCGSCCDPVMLPYGKLEAVRWAMDPADRRWTLEDLTLMSHKEVKAKDPEFYAAVMDIDRKLSLNGDRPFFFSCKNFDEQTRECRIYEKRPPACRDYPWRGKAPRKTPLPSSCSFRADIGQPVIFREKPL